MCRYAIFLQPNNLKCEYRWNFNNRLSGRIIKIKTVLFQRQKIRE